MAALRLIACVAALAACYDEPRPACGFQCGPPATSAGPGECPDGYTCVEDRCQLDPATECPPFEEPPGVTDLTPPGVMTRSPMPDETGVALDAVVLVTFDEDVQGVNAASFGVTTDQRFVPGSITVASPARAFRFTPDRPLVANRSYEVVLGTGAFGVTDLAGNYLPETRWTFSTIEDRVGPMVVASTPPDGATLVPVTTPVSLRFDEAVIGVTTASVRLEEAGVPVATSFSMPMVDVLELSHAPLATGTAYTIVLTSEVTDPAGNPLTPVTLTFTTAP